MVYVTLSVSHPCHKAGRDTSAPVHTGAFRMPGQRRPPPIGTAPALRQRGKHKELPLMALSDRVATTQKNATGLPCSVGVLLDTLEGDELAALEQILASRSWSQAMVWKALTDEGYEVGMQSINRHRGEKCRCARDRK